MGVCNKQLTSDDNISGTRGLIQYHKFNDNIYSIIYSILEHLPPLGNVHRLNYPWDLINKCDGSSNVVKNLHIADLLPRHWHVLKKFHDSMWHVFQSTENQKKI